MSIKVRVSNQLDPGNAWEVTLPEPLATIGRQATCSVALPDPEKHVSRVHATIEARNGGYFLVVNSKVNPVQLDGEACIPGTPAPLKDGCRLSLYPFELAIAISAGGSALPPAPATNPFAAPAFPAAAAPARDGNDPFAWLDDLHAGGAAPPPVDPFGLGVAPPPPPPAAAPAAPDPFRRDAPPAVGSGLLAGLGATPSPPPSGPLGLDAMPAGGLGVGSPLGTPASLDPLALLGGGGSPGAASLLAPAAPAAARPAGVDSFLGLDLGPAAAAPGAPLVDFGGHAHEGSSNLDHVHDFNLPFTPPMPEPAAPWEAPPPAPPPMPRAAAAVGGSDSHVCAFLKGLGAAGFRVPPGEADAFFERAGEIVRASVQALITLLLARGEIKKELRAADRTMLAAQNNNPLKFMAGTDEAVRFLFDPGSANAGAFLPPAQAIADACDELVAHEMALVAGMRAAVVGSIKRFDPVVLEQKLSGGLPLTRKSRLWELYLEQYAKLQQDMADDLDRLFESEFQSAYAEQVRRMKKH